MRTAIVNTREHLIEKYGVLLTVNNVAELLQRTPSGLRWSLSQGGTEPGLAFLRSSAIKIGRKIYFPADALAKIIDGDITPYSEETVDGEPANKK